jgi:choline dehydrogenase-like flavoprotein
MNNLGHHATGDPFSGKIMGAITNAATIEPDTRQRSYAASAYLNPVKDRTNLTVITGVCVTRIVLTGSYPNVIATGVEYTRDTECFTVQANEEVILAAGALNTPKLLEVSGIGGSAVLQPLGIYPIIDNPNVGENLQDHPMAGMSFQVREGVNTVDSLLRLDLKLIQKVMKEYQETRTGPFSVGGIYSYAFLALPPEEQQALAKYISKYSQKPGTSSLKIKHTSYVRDLVLNPNESSAGYFAYPAQGNFGREEPDKGMVTSDFLPGGFYSISACLFQPLSRGSVHIQSADVAIAPKIDPRYFSHPLDLEVFAQHLTFVSKLISTAPLSNFLKPGGLRNTLAPKDLSSVSEMKEYLKKTTLSNWAPTSTCAMLPENDGGVVTERLTVHGTRNLRIVDASVFPITTRGNPMATVYAVAERASDIIKEDFSLCRRQ